MCAITVFIIVCVCFFRGRGKPHINLLITHKRVINKLITILVWVNGIGHQDPLSVGNFPTKFGNASVDVASSPMLN